MKHFLFPILIFLSLSCTSQSQIRGGIENFISSDTLRLLFTGDLMQHQAQIDAALTDSSTYDYSPCFEYIKEEAQRADFAIANLEVTLGGKPYKGYPAFSAPDEFLQAIRNAGFNVLVTANNHCLDRGRKGLERTIRQLDSCGIQHTGTYTDKEDRNKRSPLLLEKNDFRIALLSYTYDTNGIAVTPPNMVNYIDTTLIAEDIEASKTLKPDIIIAYMHWGTEYRSLPDPEQIRLADWLIEKGVNHVIGSHPHVVQPMEVRTDSLTNEKHLIAYSLGNYISNMSLRGTDGGVMLRMEFIKSGTVRLHDCAYSLVWTARPALSGKKNYRILPANLPQDSIPMKGRKSLKIFIDDTRSLFKRHNRGIKEYDFFEKKVAKSFGD